MELGVQAEGFSIAFLRTGKEIRFRFWLSEDKADTASRTCLPAGRAAASQKWKIIYLQVLSEWGAEF